MSAGLSADSGQVVIAGAGYAGLHIALRLTARRRGGSRPQLVLVDHHDYHQAITELPRVAAGTRAADAVRIPIQDTLADRVSFVQAEITGFDLTGRRRGAGLGGGRPVALGGRGRRRSRAAAPPGHRGDRRRRSHRG
jgi:hypothetical protein